MTAWVRIKICGITRLEDALAAAELGVDALGFNFWPQSPRFIAPSSARKIIARLPPFLSTVGLFVNQSRTHLQRAVKDSGVAWVQLHGDESPAFCRAFQPRVMKAIQVRDAASVRGLSRFPVSAWVLDAPSKGYGGSGKTFDWALARSAAKRMPVLLAGGLNPENVADAVRQVSPWGVDVTSGVEARPGVKDLQKLRRFVEAVHSASNLSSPRELGRKEAKQLGPKPRR